VTRLAAVFGGGGIVGLGWELGVVEGLREAGVDLATADRSIGTSAGAIVGAVLTAGIPIEELPERADELGPDLETLTSQVDLARVDEIAEHWRAAGMRPSQPERAAIGALALTAPAAAPDVFVAVLRRLLPEHAWPSGLVVTAVRATDGEFVTWDERSGVALATAVAASCALPGVFAPVRVATDRYIDGGVRSPLNLDLAAGAELAVLLAPSGRDELADVIAVEGEAVVAEGGRVVEILPDAAGLEAIGPDLMDVERLLPAAMAGYEQGLRTAGQLAAGLRAA
jgi:NTE family protein